MKVSAYIIDDFYSNVDDVRNHALTQNFNVKGNFPGCRTISFINDSVKSTIESIVSPIYGKVINWWDLQYTGAYQYTLASNKSWIHADQTTRWAGVCYLTPNPPTNSGTALFKHKETGLSSAPLLKNGAYDTELLTKINKDSVDMSAWEMTDRFANKYNRLIIYKGDCFHSSLDYFGTDINTSRLFQVFFFNTEIY